MPFVSDFNSGHLMREALNLYQELFRGSRATPAMPPEDQLTSLEQLFKGPVVQLKQLHEKVQQLFIKQGFPDLISMAKVQESLEASDQVCEDLHLTQTKLMACWDLYAQAKHLLLSDASKNREALKSLQPRVAQIVQSGSLNPGCSAAFDSLQKNLNLVVQDPLKQTSGQEKPQLSGNDQKIFAMVASLRVQFKGLQEVWNKTKKFPSNQHVQNFEALLELYGKVKQLKELISHGILAPEEMQEIDTFLAHREQLLRRIVDAVAQEAHVLAFCNALDSGNDSASQDAFFQMTDKSVFGVHLFSLLKLKFRSQHLQLPNDLAKWPGTNADKKAAAQKLLSGTCGDSPQQIQEKAKAMRRQLEEAIAGSSLEDVPQSSDDAPPANPHLESIRKLESTLALLQHTSVPAAFRWILAEQELASLKDCPLSFEGAQNLAAGRTFFHLSQIQKNASSSVVSDDLDAGAKSFRGEHGFHATDVQRTRALQRTMIELALSGLEKSIGADENTAVFLDILDGVDINSLDLPQGLGKISHALFGEVYQCQIKAREKDSTLEDPNHHKFKGDFGRVALSTPIAGVDRATRLQAIAQVRSALIKTWNL